MPSQKRKLVEPDISALKQEESSEPNFQIAVNPKDSGASTYVSTFDPRLNLKYAVHLDGSREVWKKLRSYKNFETGDSKIVIPILSYIYVKGVASASKGARAKFQENTVALDEEEVEYQDWVAQVLECRAANGQNVFLRVVWLYWPDDLQGFGGRQDHHGEVEVIPSNHMQIINAVTVSGQVDVKQWDDHDDPNHTADCLPWRQTLNVYATRRKLALGPKPATHCICDKPANPGRFLVQCGACRRWSHKECILANAVREAPKEALEQSARNLTPNSKQHPVKDKILDPEEPAFNEDEVKISASDTISVENRSSFLTRVIDKVLPSRDSPIRNLEDKDKLIALTNAHQLSNKKRKVAFEEPSFSLSQEETTPGLGDDRFEAKFREPSPEHPEVTICISGHDKEGSRREWEQPIYCLFKDCGETILHE